MLIEFAVLLRGAPQQPDLFSGEHRSRNDETVGFISFQHFIVHRTSRHCFSFQRNNFILAKARPRSRFRDLGYHTTQLPIFVFFFAAREPNVRLTLPTTSLQCPRRTSGSEPGGGGGSFAIRACDARPSWNMIWPKITRTIPHHKFTLMPRLRAYRSMLPLVAMPKAVRMMPTKVNIRPMGMRRSRFIGSPQANNQAKKMFSAIAPISTAIPSVSGRCHHAR